MDEGPEQGSKGDGGQANAEPLDAGPPMPIDAAEPSPAGAASPTDLAEPSSAGPTEPTASEPTATREHERAIELAYRAVGYRDRTVAELRAFLERKRVEPAAIDEAVAELTEAGFLDDARYAKRFAEDKRELERWGRERIARDLRRRGVAADLIEAALAEQSRQGELDTALMLLEQRMAPPRDDRERNRAWRLLVRRGYAPELAYEAVRRHEADERRAA